MHQQFRATGPTRLDSYTEAVLDAWHFMGGAIDWRAAEIWIDMTGHPDPERLLRGLVQLRDHQQERARRASR